jgi:hypothetical protein
MVWPITGAESYVGKMGESMKAVELRAAQQDGCCNIAIALIDPRRPFSMSEIACFQQLAAHIGCSLFGLSAI